MKNIEALIEWFRRVGKSVGRRDEHIKQHKIKEKISVQGLFNTARNIYWRVFVDYKETILVNKTWVQEFYHD